MARNYQNFISGTTTNNPLTVGGTTLNSAGLASLAAIAGPTTAMIVLDPQAVNGAPEIVIVTAHTGSATSATITRAALGTTARQHNLGTTWVHSALADDMISATLLLAKGTILAASGAGTAVGVAVGADGAAVIADAASAGGVKFGVPVPYLSKVQYAPDPTHSYTGGGSVAAIDTTHMRLPDFTPTTNLVRVDISGYIHDALTTGERPAVCVITQGTTTVLGGLMGVEGGLSAYSHTFHVEEYVTVVAGTTYHWDVGWVPQAGNPTICAYGGTTIGSLGAPLVCTVYPA